MYIFFTYFFKFNCKDEDNTSLIKDFYENDKKNLSLYRNNCYQNVFLGVEKSLKLHII